MSRYNYDNLVREMRAQNNDEKKQFVDQIGMGRLLDYINEAAKTSFRIEDRIDMPGAIYDRAEGQKKLIEVLGLLPESERVKLIQKISFQFRAYLKVAALPRDESGQNLYFDVFNGGELTTAWGGFRFIGIDYDWDEFLKRAGNYVRNAEESRFGCGKKDWFDAISTFIPADSRERFIDAVGLEIYAKINRQNATSSTSCSSAFFKTAVPFSAACSNKNNVDILEGLIVPSHPLPVIGVVIEEKRKMLA